MRKGAKLGEGTFCQQAVGDTSASPTVVTSLTSDIFNSWHVLGSNNLDIV